nr:hypothetical protein [Tanacetum cinerariifolium]
PSFSGRIVPLFDTMLVQQGEGSGTPTEPHHIPSPEAQPPSPTTHSSPTLPLVTTTSIPAVTPSEITPIRHYTRRTRIAQSSALSTVADEPDSLLRDVTPRVTSLAADEGSMQKTISELTALCTSLQRQHSELLAKFQAQEVEINRSVDEGEATAKRISDDSEEMANVLTSMDAAIVLAGGIADVPTGSGSIPTASTPAKEQVPTVSDVVPTASPVFATATVGKGSGTPTEPHHTPFPEADTSSHPTTSSIPLPSIPTAPIPPVTQPDTTPIRQYSRRARIAQSSILLTVADEPASPVRDAQEEEIVKLKERVKVLEDKEDIPVTLSGDDAPIKGRSINEREAAAERIRGIDVPTGSGFIPTAGPPATVISTGSEGMIDSLDKSNETIAKYLQEYQEFALELPLEKRIKLISDLVKYQDNYSKVYKFQSKQRRPITKKQKREYYMAVIKSNLGCRFKDFKGMIFEEIEAKFAEVWKQVENFIPLGSKEETKKLKRKGLNLEKEQEKKQKLSEEAPEIETSTEEFTEEKMKEMMQLVPVEDVYVQALQVKHPIIDWKVHTEVKEYLSIRPASSEKEMELWVELKRMYEPDPEDQLWTLTQNFMHAPIEWKLYDLSGVHHVTSKDREIFMLVEKDYPLRKGLALVMISYKLQVKNYSQMADDLIRKIYNVANSLRNQVIQNIVQNPRIQNVGNQNRLIGVPGNANQNSNRNGNLVAARAEGNATGHNDLDEIEEVNANCILMANLQQASKSGTQTNKAPVYDSDRLAEVYNYENYDDNEVFNIFTQEEQYTELLEPIPKPHQVPHNDNNVISKFAKQSILGKPPKVGETHALSKPVTSNLIPTPQGSKVVKNVKPHVITKKVVNSDSNGLSSTGVDNTKTIRPHPRSNTKNDRVPSVSKSSQRKNKEIEVEEHQRKLLLSRNKKYRSSECNNVKIASQNVKSKANVSINARQKKQEPKVKKTKKVGSIKRLASSKPSKPRSFHRWSQTGRFFDLKGIIIASSESESQSDCSKGDNVCTSNPLEPTIKRFSNSTFSLPGNRTTNLYTINLHEMDSASLICLMVCASSTKSWLWHQHLSHLNFDTINDLAKNDLVIGLPKFKYHKEHLCSSCEQGKRKRASHPPKPVPNSRQRLHLLHMDLCGPMRIASINEKQTDNGTEFKNQVLKEYFDSVGISHQVSSVRTPQQNGVVEQRNQTLVEAARTMLIFSRAQLFLWAKVIATVCFTQNCSIIHRRFNKTPYELINERKPDISFLHVFGVLCYPKNDREDIGKLSAKGDIGFFIGYSADSCAFRVYNRRINKIMETMNVSFDELLAMSFEQCSLKPGRQSMTSGQISPGLDLTYAPSTITTQQPTEGELDLLFEAMYDDYIGGQPSTAS